MRQGKKAVRVAHITALVVVQTEEATKVGDGGRKGKWQGQDRVLWHCLFIEHFVAKRNF